VQRVDVAVDGDRGVKRSEGGARGAALHAQSLAVAPRPELGVDRVHFDQRAVLVAGEGDVRSRGVGKRRCHSPEDLREHGSDALRIVNADGHVMNHAVDSSPFAPPAPTLTGSVQSCRRPVVAPHLTTWSVAASRDAMAAEQDADRASPLAAYYDRLAGVYGAGEYSAARRAAVLGGIAAELAAARAVLDLGCGNGAFLPDLAAAPAAERAVIGMDLSTAMLAAAHERIGGRVDLVRGDALAVPFRAGAFDLVLMSHVLLLISDVGACVADVARVLRSGGVLIATVGAGGWPEALRQAIGGAFIRELEDVFGTVRPRERRDDEGAVTAACRRSGLCAAWRTAEFRVSWPAVEEWLRLRWLSIADDALRARAEAWLASAASGLADISLDLGEKLLVAVKE